MSEVENLIKKMKLSVLRKSFNEDEYAKDFCFQLKNLLKNQKEDPLMVIDKIISDNKNFLLYQEIIMMGQKSAIIKHSDIHFDFMKDYNPIDKNIPRFQHEIFERYIDLKEKIDKGLIELKKTIRTGGPSKPVWVLYLHYIEKNCNKYSGRKSGIEKFKEDSGITFSTDAIYNMLHEIGRGSEKDPLKRTYIKKVIPMLDKYPEAQQAANQDLMSFQDE